jgi:urease accessory protein
MKGRSHRYDSGRAAVAVAAAVALAGLTALTTPLPLAAHEGGTAAGLASGLLHPVTGPDHVLAMIAVGIWGAQLGAPAIWVLPVTFPMVMALGGMAGLLGLPLPGVEIGIGVSAVLLGTMVGLERRPDLRVAAVLVGFFAIFHGYAHGTELPEGQSGLLYSIGFVVSTGMLHATGIGIGELRRLSWGGTALRSAGAAIALAGVWFTWTAITGG